MNKQQEPRLRFKDFTEVWEEKVLGEILSVRNEFVDSSLYDLDVELENLISNSGILVGDTSVRTQTTSSFRKGDILFGRLRPYLNKWWLAEKDGVKSGEIWALETSSKYSNSFAYLLVQSRKFLETANVTSGTKMPRADWRSLTAITFKSPSKPEQTHLGLFFSRLDSQIAESRAVLEKSRQLKKAMLAKMFPTNGEKIPEIRFKGFEGEWESRKLGEIAFKVKEKNIAYQYAETFTNSAEFGIISQQDFFDKSISNSENIGGYYVVQPDDFVYNPRISSFAPVGPIKRNKLGRTGVMSPLYYVFRLNDEIKPSYLEQYFEGNQWHHFMYLNGDTGARSDRFSIKNDVFAEMPISFPANKNEQTQIGNFFRQLDETIALQSAEVEKLNQLKKGLLAAMLV
ncbi:restriction endonuclease subunit S [Neisseria subflava]|jgi:hypothetical protein|uniref:restriction endonuclease subunit S n=1 Tax=Neisseria TaxID=482 RepID=UPI001F48F197|nr:restriction endonuclease subunit S [Neisseria subflava]